MPAVDVAGSVLDVSTIDFVTSVDPGWTVTDAGQVPPMAVDPASLTSSACVTAAVGVYVTVYVPSPLSSTVSVSSAFASPAFFSVSVLVC